MCSLCFICEINESVASTCYQFRSVLSKRPNQPCFPDEERVSILPFSFRLSPFTSHLKPFTLRLSPFTSYLMPHCFTDEAPALCFCRRDENQLSIINLQLPIPHHRHFERSLRSREIYFGGFRFSYAELTFLHSFLGRNDVYQSDSLFH